MKVDIASLQQGVYKAQQVKIVADRNLAEAWEALRKGLLMDMKDTAAAAGFGDLKELLDAPKKSHSKKSHGYRLTAKYRNPKNPAETWAGTGRLPKWLAASVAAGHDRETFRVKA